MNEISLAKNWILFSGTQNSNGGVHRLFDNKLKKYDYVYPEITGYFITTCCNIFFHYKTKEAVDKAVAAADFLIKNIHNSGGVYQKIKNGKRYQLLCSFDTGMCMNGLIELYKITKDEKYMEYVKKMSNFIFSLSKNKLGIPFPAVKNNKPVLTDRWSLSFGCHLIKLCIPLYKMYLITEDEKHIESIKRILEKLMPLLDRNKFYVNSKNKIVYLHSNCYALEGLAFLDYVKYDNFKDILSRCSDWLAENWKGNTDSVAQVMRILLYVDKEKYKEEIDEIEKLLLSRQSKQEDKRCNGGFYYNNEKKHHINSWSTFFSLQALIWNKAKKIDFDKIV